MDARHNVQVINDQNGNPAFVVIPYADYIAQRDKEKDLIPDAVARRILLDDMTPVRAWREYLGLTQKEVAARLGVSQPAYAEQENGTRLRKSSRQKIAAALGINAAQLDV